MPTFKLITRRSQVQIPSPPPNSATGVSRFLLGRLDLSPAHSSAVDQYHKQSWFVPAASIVYIRKSMRDVIEILKLRWLIIRRVTIETSWKDRLKIPIYVLLSLMLAWKGVGSLISALYAELDESVFVIVPWWSIVIVGVIVLLEGLRSTTRQLYKNPENDLLLTLPIQLKHLLLAKWLEKLLLNIAFMSFCVLVLFQYSRFVPVTWTYTLLSINVLLIIQQLYDL